MMTEAIDAAFRILPLAGVGALMISMGLGLDVSHFRQVARAPRALMAGLAGQIILLPVVAFGICFVFDLPNHVALGLMVIAACPGGATSNAFSVLIRGDIPLSITLTAISSFFSFLTVPIIIGLAISQFGFGSQTVRLSFGDTAVQLLITTALPIGIGMVLRRLRSKWPQKLVVPLYWFGFVALLLPSFTFFSTFSGAFDRHDMIPAMTAALLNFVMVGVTFPLARALALGPVQTRTLAIEVGIQNYGLILAIIVVFLKDTRLLAPAFIYLPAMLISASLIAALMRLKTPKLV
jgi:bile acid:Na+ symporter, BASS family